MSDESQSADPAEGPESRVGETIGKYQLIREVGRGGMGTVYEALNTTINKRVAMKCIDTELARNEEASARFQREALAASAIESPQIVQIFDAGMTDQGMPYIVMELLRGRNLGECIAELGRLELVDAIGVVAQVLKGLHHAHSAGIIHRDLKPDNVFLVERDDEPYAVKVLDFGVSKIARREGVPLQTLTQQGTVVGTPFYMSPEQAQAFPDVDHRTDLYSVGAILYESLTGRPPHAGQSYEQVIVRICSTDAEDVRVHNPQVPEPMARLIARALSREREDRFESARHLLEALMELAPDEMRVRFGSSASGLRRVVSSAAQASPTTTLPSLDVTTPAGTPPEASGPPEPSRQPLADTVKADSGMMSVVAPPSVPAGVPAAWSRRKWMLGLVAAVVAAVGGAGLVLSSMGEPGDGQRGAVTSVAADGAGGTSSLDEPPSAPPEPSASADGGEGVGDDGGPASSSTEPSVAPPRRPPPASTKPPTPPRPPARPSATGTTPPPLPSVTPTPSKTSGLPLFDK